MAIERKDIWASGEAYEPYVGRWSRLVARQFLAWPEGPGQSHWRGVWQGSGQQGLLDTGRGMQVSL